MAATNLTIVILDGVGVGAAPDAKHYKDCNAHTVSLLSGHNTFRSALKANTGSDINASYCELAPDTEGKGTTTGHWNLFDMNGDIKLSPMSSVWPEKFSEMVLGICGQKTMHLGFHNNGTKLVQEMGLEASKQKTMIAYTSSDAILQIAACETNIGLCRLREVGKLVALQLPGDFGLGRVITRPYLIDDKGKCVRTDNRSDFHAKPTSDNIFNDLNQADVRRLFYGKANEIFHWVPKASFDKETSGLAAVRICLESGVKGFDLLKGKKELHVVNFRSIDDCLHLEDLVGAKIAFIEVINLLRGILGYVECNNILLITADHGCDIRVNCNENTREFVPVCLFGGNKQLHEKLKNARFMSDVSRLVRQAFSI